MKRFKNILLVARQSQPSDALVRRVAGLAKNNGAAISVAGVIDVSRLNAEVAKDLDSLIAESRRLQVKLFAREIEDQGVTTGVRLLRGIEFLEIIRLVIREQFDLVLLQGAEKGTAARLDSSTMHLLRKCPCPVWVMHSEQPEEHRRIVAAVDQPRPHDFDSARAVNETIMEMSTSLARLERCELHVVHGWSVDLGGLLRQPSGLTEERKTAYREGVRGSVERDVTRFAELYAGDDLEMRIHVIEGTAARVVVDTAATLKADLIVMGTVARTGIPGFIIGNTAESILADVHCSVLAVKPPEFATPVSLEAH